MVNPVVKRRRGTYKFDRLVADVLDAPGIDPGLISIFGNTYYVDSGVGSDNNGGRSPRDQLATIDAAVGKCTANQGDKIVVAEGHVETISSAGLLDLDVAGISVIGLGHGDSRPQLLLTTVTTADIDVDAADILVANCRIAVDIDSLAVIFDVNAKRFWLLDCEFEETAAKQWLVAIDINGGSGNACDGVRITRCKIKQTTAGATRAIELGEVADEVTIEYCSIDGDFDDAGIHNPTGKVLTDLHLIGNFVRNRQTGDHAIELVSACTGEADGGMLVGDTAAAIFDPGSLFVGNIAYATAIDQESADVVPLFPAAAVPANGVSVEAALRKVYEEGVQQREDTGNEADIDVSAGDYTAFLALLTIVPAASSPIFDLEVHFDLAKATTGFVAGYTTETIQFCIARKIDGTNWRRDAETYTTAVAANATGLQGITLKPGYVGVDEEVRIEVLVTAEQADVEMPYAAYYKAAAAATFTPVAAV